MAETSTDTSMLLKQEPNSTIFGVSIRAWITLIIVLTICLSFLTVVIGIIVHAVLTKDWSLVGTFTTVGEPLYTLAGLTVGFYFGQKTSTKA